LLLDPSNKINKESDKVTDVLKQLVALNKSPEDIAADYLRKIWQYTKEDIQKVRGDDWAEIYTVRAVLTVPAIWSDSAKDRTMRIAHLAGLPEDVSLVTEPEAAALAVLRERKDDGESLQVGDCFVVCDAGGGTVDLISYKIVSLDPFQVEECAVGDGEYEEISTLNVDLADLPNRWFVRLRVSRSGIRKIHQDYRWRNAVANAEGQVQASHVEGLGVSNKEMLLW
jgi:hypothetical protein